MFCLSPVFREMDVLAGVPGALMTSRGATFCGPCALALLFCDLVVA